MTVEDVLYTTSRLQPINILFGSRRSVRRVAMAIDLPVYSCEVAVQKRINRALGTCCRRRTLF